MNATRIGFTQKREMEKSFSIPDAAKQFGLDSFCVYALIQRGKLHAERASWGELLISQIEIARMLNREDGQEATVC